MLKELKVTLKIPLEVTAFNEFSVEASWFYDVKYVYLDWFSLP